MGEDIAILLPYDLRKKQIEMLNLLGFGEDRIVWIERTMRKGVVLEQSWIEKFSLSIHIDTVT